MGNLCLLFIIFGLVSLLGILSLDETGVANSEVNVLLRAQSDIKAGHVDNLFAHLDVSLMNEDASRVDGFGKYKLEQLGLEMTLKEFLNLKTEHIIELIQLSSKMLMRTR